MTFNNILWPTVGADDANEQNNPGIRIGASTVMLSTAKHLAALRVTVEGPIMQIEYFMRTAEYPGEADKAALGTINRPLQRSSLFYYCALSALAGFPAIQMKK